MKGLEHLGGNFWMTDDGWVFNTTTQSFFHSADLPATMKYSMSVGNHPLYLSSSDFPTIDGTKFVTIDYCEDYFYSKSGKTQFAKFIGSEYISNGTVGGKEYAYNFDIGQVYAFFFEVNLNYPYNLRLIKYTKINKNVKNTLEKDAGQGLDRDLRTTRGEANQRDADKRKDTKRKSQGSGGGIQGSLFC